MENDSLLLQLCFAVTGAEERLCLVHIKEVHCASTLVSYAHSQVDCRLSFARTGLT